MGTTLHYNGVTLRNCETKVFDQSVEYDPSGTDTIYSKFRIRVASTLAYFTSAGDEHLVEVPRGSTIVERAHELHPRLSAPRKDFWFVIEGARIGRSQPTSATQSLLVATGDERGHTFTVPSWDGTPIARAAILDTNNGPKPREVRISQIFGGAALRVEFEIEVCRKLCYPGFTDEYPHTVAAGQIQPSTMVLNNRWHLEESKDASWKTTRVLQGTLRVAHHSAWLHAHRFLCLPRLLDGYQRVSQSFVDDPTGLVLKYRVEDRQREMSPPPPAVDWSGHQVESTTNFGGSKVGELRLRMIGPPGVDKRELIASTGWIVGQRYAGLQKKSTSASSGHQYDTKLESASIVNVLDEPVIEMRVRVRFTKAGYKFFAMRINELAQPLPSIDGYNPRRWPVPLPFDSAAPAGLFSCYLQDPCSVWHGMPIARPYTTPSGTSTSSTTGRPNSDSDVQYDRYGAESPLPEDTEDDSEIDANTLDRAPFTHLMIRNVYDVHTGYMQLPLSTTAEPGEGEPAPDTCVIAEVHKPLARRLFFMRAVRDGEMPWIPAPVEELTDPNGITERLLHHRTTLLSPSHMADDVTRRFDVAVMYEYALSRPPSESEKLRMASTPLDSHTPLENAVSGTALYANTDKIIYRGQQDEPE